jgi:hypothetical protein
MLDQKEAPQKADQEAPQQAAQESPQQAAQSAPPQVAENAPQQSTPAAPVPPTEEEKHQKYDVTVQDVAKLDKAVTQYEKYQIVAMEDRQRAEDRPLDQGAQARANRSEAFAEKYYNKNIKPIEDRMVDPNQNKVKPFREYEPGVDVSAASKLAMRAHTDHICGPDTHHPNEIRPGAFSAGVTEMGEGSHSRQEIPALRSEMYREEAREHAREAVGRGPAKTAAGHGL